MPFLNLDDNFADHEKVDALSDGGFRLHVSALLYCSRHKTDGFVPLDRVSRLMPRYKRSYLTELLDARLWYTRPGDRIEAHDYLDWNKSREQIENDRERIRKVRSEAGKKGANKRWHSA
jgi:hypothetical protein